MSIKYCSKYYLNTIHNIILMTTYALYAKYKSSYLGASLDMIKHLIVFIPSFYLLYYFKNSNSSIITIPIMSLILHRSFIIFHDSVHNSYTPNKIINYFISSIIGIGVLTSPNWILDHHTHHLTNGNIENKFKFKFNELIYYNVDQFKKFTYFTKLICNFFYIPAIYFTVFPILYFFILQRFLYIYKKIKYCNKINKSLGMISFDHIINNFGISIGLCYLYKYEIMYHYLLSVYISFIINFLFFFCQHTFNPPYIVNN